MTTLTTRRLLLRAWAPGDEDSLVDLANNWNVARNLRDVFPYPYTREDAVRWVAQSARVEGPLLDFAIVLAGRAIGSIGLAPKADIDRAGIELGYWLGEPYWGNGYVAEAVHPVVGYAFATFAEVRVVQARHLARNPASGRVLRKCGFTLEGCLRQAAIKADEVQDVLVYSLTREEHARR
jgi:RimJ/RimL family protein N-acetyltransferase